jgi:opacity protein-like surface antigen
VRIADRATVSGRNKSAEEGTNLKTNLLLAAIAWTVLTAPAVWAQKGIEVTPFVGGQINGGVNLSTSIYNNLNVQNGLNYGVSATYLIREYTGVDFIWNHNQGGAIARPVNGGPDQQVFELNSNQYLGNFVIHFKNRESRIRPYALLGAGVTTLAADRGHANTATRFAWVFGGGVKYTLSKHLGVRVQAKWSPTYIDTTTAGVWCDPYWGGCWTKGASVFLHEFDGTAGLTFRF